MPGARLSETDPRSARVVGSSPVPSAHSSRWIIGSASRVSQIEKCELHSIRRWKNERCVSPRRTTRSNAGSPAVATTTPHGHVSAVASGRWAIWSAGESRHDTGERRFRGRGEAPRVTLIPSPRRSRARQGTVPHSPGLPGWPRRNWVGRHAFGAPLLRPPDNRQKSADCVHGASHYRRPKASERGAVRPARDQPNLRLLAARSGVVDKLVGRVARGHQEVLHVLKASQPGVCPERCLGAFQLLSAPARAARSRRSSAVRVNSPQVTTDESAGDYRRRAPALGLW